MVKELVNKNKKYILLLGILGICYALLDWDINISDLFYLKYNNKVLISIITAGIGLSRFIATFVCVKINDTKKPNMVFNILIIFCMITTIISCLFYQYGFAIYFTIVYLLLQVFLEILSSFHFPYVSKSLPDNQIIQTHSKRISIFKILNAAGVALASFICTTFYNKSFLIICALCTIIFLITIMIVINIKNINIKSMKNEESYLQKFNIKKYSYNFKIWSIVRIIGKFSTASLVVILSLKALESNVDILALKTSKTLLWIFSSIGFFLSGYFIKKKKIVDGDIFLKLLIVIMLPLTLVSNYAPLIIIVLYGILEPFNSISHLEILKQDKDGIDLAQKDLIISLFGYFSKFLSGMILVNIKFNIAITIIIILLSLSVFIEYKLYRKLKKQC